MKPQEQSKLKINFQLKSEKSARKPVLAYINFGYKEIDLLTRKAKYKPIILKTRIKLLTEEWDERKKAPIHSDTALEMDRIRETIEDIYKVLTLKKKNFTYYDFQAEIDSAFGGSREVREVISKVQITEFIREHILKSNTLKKTSKSSYSTLCSYIEDFEKRLGKTVQSHEIDETMWLEFMDLVREKVKTINAVWAMQKVFTTVLHEIARKYKIKVFDPGKELNPRDRVQAETADKIYLNMDQIEQIMKTDPDEERLENVKFIFMILLFTGCRESDVYKIKPELSHIANGEKFSYVRYFAQKTETEILVPILKPLQKMFDKNKGNPPRKISQQRFNQWVKELIMKCKMKADVTTTYTNSQGTKQSVTKKLYEFVTSHTGRRSFITNLINFIPLPTLTKITGHKLEDKNIVFAYNKMTLLENATLFRKLVRRAKEENPEYFPFDLV